MSSVRNRNRNLFINYTFKFEDGQEKSFKLNFDQNEFKINHEIEIKSPEWTKLENFQCPHCPLELSENEYCPIAVEISRVIDEFKDLPSFEKVEMIIETNQRTYTNSSTVQTGVSGLLGVIMPSSGCPILGKLKPLARYHLPFSSLEETEFRVISMYLLAQFMRMKEGSDPDWKLKGLQKIYDDIHKVNQYIFEKISALENKDASINAVIILNNFADTVSMSIEEEDLWKIEPLFKDYLKNN